MSGRTKQVVVELFGVVRKLAGTAEVELDLEPAATVSDALRALAASCPALEGAVIDAEGGSLMPHFLLNLDGRETVREFDLQPQPGARLLLMSAIVGG